MATHTDNLHYGNSIVGSNINVDTINQVDGINPASILSYLPRVHDLSDQVDGITKEFILSPPIVQGTQNLFILFLDGVALTRALNIGDADYYISDNLQQIVIGNNMNIPPVGSTLLAVYVEDNSILP